MEPIITIYSAGIISFLITMLIGIACISVHYRRRYEDLKEFIRLMIR